MTSQKFTEIHSVENASPMAVIKFKLTLRIMATTDVQMGPKYWICSPGIMPQAKPMLPIARNAETKNKFWKMMMSTEEVGLRELVR